MSQDEGQKSWAASVGKAVNGKPLDVASWTTGVITVAPGYHRIKNAIGLSVGLYTGRKLMNIVCGAKPNGEKVAREDVPLPLRPLHGILEYDHFSDAPKDRWMKVLDNMAPAAFGAAGAMAGSYQFFEGRARTLKNPQFMDEFEESMSYEQSKPWNLMAGITSLMGSASGLSLGPIGNYGSSLGNRFALASGRKIALPGLGKFMSGNTTRAGVGLAAEGNTTNYPFGPVQLIERMVHYAAGNPEQTPAQLEKMAHGALASWFKDVSKDQVDAFVGVIQNIRHQFLEEGGIPEEAQKKVKDLLHQHLKRGGLESTLRDIGLDPLEADLGSNGFATTVAKLLGKEGKMAEMATDFASKYASRNSGASVER